MSASATVSPNKITMRSRSQMAIRNYNNPQYHTSLDLAKAYSGMVQTHLHAAQYENHVLKSAERGYKRQLLTKSNKRTDQKEKQIKRAKSSLNIFQRSKNNSNKKMITIEGGKIVRNPEDQHTSKSVIVGQSPQDTYEKQRKSQLKQVLTRKTLRVPQYSEELQQACSFKSMLQKQIAKLKWLINSQKKKKAKISLHCNKIMNDREYTYKNYKDREAENFHLNVNILATEKENQFLRQQINQLNQKNNKTMQRIEEEKTECDTLRKYVQKTRLVVFDEEKDVAKLKTMVSTSYNNMSNNFMNMNQLKSQKALLLSDIQSNHAKNR